MLELICTPKPITWESGWNETGKNLPLLPFSRAATIKDRTGFPSQGQAFQILPFQLRGRPAHTGAQQHVNSIIPSPVMLTSCEAHLRSQARRGPGTSWVVAHDEQGAMPVWKCL